MLVSEARAVFVTPPVVMANPPREELPPFQPRPGTAGTAPAPKVERAPSGNPLWGIPLRLLTATVARPLFAPSRRPPPPVVANVNRAAVPVSAEPPKPVESEKPPLALIGTVSGGAEEGIGVFLDQTAKSTLRLRAGEEHKGWVLRAVQSREVVLEKGRQSTVLTLPAPQMKATGPVAGPGGAVAPIGTTPAPVAGGAPTATVGRAPATSPAFQAPSVTTSAPPVNPFEQVWKQQMRQQPPQR
jgi:hypothetical protein